ncbi:MAG: UDP-2,3-diacylglucosamine diphosphatase [Candidatus Polarisedimenticolaceae bacterium]|nr:UDP-2,3-diacylglucosamine diphosphatase [Candidatus Polarisedimenticolaceae bacterium]
MKETLFISDLHLSPDHPESVELFLRFLGHRAQRAEALYILGDLFDAWIGDDNETAPVPTILAAMSALKEKGCKLYIMQGNRDFLLGEAFAEKAAATLLSDPSLIDLYGTPTLLMHGDLLCTDDVAYQQYRKQIRAPALIADFLSKPIPERIVVATEMRRQSGDINEAKSENIMDVNRQTVEEFMLDNGAKLLIHGHTHRPDEHDHDLNGSHACRIVLADWRGDKGELLSVTHDEINREMLSLS